MLQLHNLLTNAMMEIHHLACLNVVRASGIQQLLDRISNDKLNSLEGINAVHHEFVAEIVAASFLVLTFSQAIPSLKPGQVVSSCPGLMSITRKVCVCVYCVCIYVSL